MFSNTGMEIKVGGVKAAELASAHLRRRGVEFSEMSQDGTYYFLFDSGAELTSALAELAVLHARNYNLKN